MISLLLFAETLDLGNIVSYFLSMAEIHDISMDVELFQFGPLEKTLVSLKISDSDLPTNCDPDILLSYTKIQSSHNPYQSTVGSFLHGPDSTTLILY